MLPPCCVLCALVLNLNSLVPTPRSQLDANHDGKLDDYEFVQLFTTVLHLQIAHNETGTLAGDPSSVPEAFLTVESPPLSRRNRH